MTVNFNRLHTMLNPKTVVVIGEKGPNYQFLQAQNKYSGKLYSVQIDEKEIPGIESLGIKNYRSLEEAPGHIDLLIVAVPRQIAPLIASQAIQRKVNGIHFFTAGFEETGEEIGNKLQDDLMKILKDNDTPVIGPNCMGIYNKKLSLRFHQAQNFSSEHNTLKGLNLSLLSQSGTHGVNVTVGAQRKGINVARSISFGNALLVNECDLLEYLINDKSTDMIAFYLEGVKDGRRFLKLINSSKKPIIIWKGGRSKAGARAVASHTASMASNAVIWDQLIKDAGGISVNSLDELINVAILFNNQKYRVSNNLALITMTGGQSVAITDAFEDHGFIIPQLSNRSYKQLEKFYNVIGGSYRNPFDAGATINKEMDNFKRILDIIGKDNNIKGGLVIDINTRIYTDNVNEFKSFLKLLNSFRNKHKMPVILVIHTLTSTLTMTDRDDNSRENVSAETSQFATDQAFPVFNSFNDAARAMSLVASHKLDANI